MPRFLERDEAEREPPCDDVSVGRRAERQAVLTVSDVGDRRGVLAAAHNPGRATYVGRLGL